MQNLNNKIESLVRVWMLWLQNHIRANNENLSYKKRRLAGMRCEKILFIRMKLIKDIDMMFDKTIKEQHNGF